MALVTEQKPDKYFLCFGFDNFSEADLRPFHVTFIYFGELLTCTESGIIKIVSHFLNNFRGYRTPRLHFVAEAFFGPNANIRVLLPVDSYELINFKSYLEPLRKELEKTSNYSGYPFNPHLTTDLNFYNGRINTLYLCKNKYEVIHAWDL